MQQPYETDPVAEPDSVQMPVQVTTPPAEELQEEPAMDDILEDAGSEEQVDNSEPATGP